MKKLLIFSVKLLGWIFYPRASYLLWKYKGYSIRGYKLNEGYFKEDLINSMRIEEDSK